jgi:2-methylcitrate dehydratase PrpD
VPPEGAPLVIDPIGQKRAPRTPYDAKFSLPYTVAHTLVHGRLDLTSFGPEEIGDEAVLALAARVSRVPAPERLPSRFCGGTEIVTAAGDRFARDVDHAPGSPANPLGEEWLLEKLGANASLALDPEPATDLIHCLRAIETGGQVEAAMEIARSARSEGS